MSNRMYFLPDHVDFYSTNSSESLAEDLSHKIVEILKQSINSDAVCPSDPTPKTTTSNGDLTC